MTKDLEKLISHCQNEVCNMARDPAIPAPTCISIFSHKEAPSFLSLDQLPGQQGTAYRPTALFASHVNVVDGTDCVLGQT
jgi:hypothetical protein